MDDIEILYVIQAHFLVVQSANGASFLAEVRTNAAETYDKFDSRVAECPSNGRSDLGRPSGRGHGDPAGSWQRHRPRP